MKNERLTIYGGNGEHYESINPIDTPYEYGKINLQKFIDKLAEYEDLEEQGLLLRLPCKIGDKVYAITRNFISEYTICSIEIYNEGFFFNWRCEKGIYINIRGFTNYQIGEDVFLTQSEAEEKLRELRESRKKNVYKLQKESTTD